MKTLRMEPELEAVAGHLSATERMEMAVTLARWAGQLQITAQSMNDAPDYKEAMSGDFRRN